MNNVFLPLLIGSLSLVHLFCIFSMQVFTSYYLFDLFVWGGELRMGSDSPVWGNFAVLELPFCI